MTRKTLAARFWASLYAVSTLYRPTRWINNRFFSAVPDAYQIRAHGDRRMLALAEAARVHIGPCESILDVTVCEGLTLQRVAQVLKVRCLAGLDLSDIALDRARTRLDEGRFQRFDLMLLYRDPTVEVPLAPADLVLVCECLYCVGPMASLLWKYPSLQNRRKKQLVEGLRKCARKGVLFQHFGERQRHGIGAIVESCGGRLVNERWGIYYLPAFPRT